MGNIMGKKLWTKNIEKMWLQKKKQKYLDSKNPQKQNVLAGQEEYGRTKQPKTKCHCVTINVVLDVVLCMHYS